MNRYPSLVASFLLAAASTSLGACSSHGSGTNPGDSVLVAGAEHVIWTNSGGGFGGWPPPGAACGLGNASYDWNVGAGSLSWSVCTVAGNNYNDPNAYSTVTGSRVLTADERAQATSATQAVKVTSTNNCGADKPSLTLEVATQSDSIVYGDDFYACLKTYEHYVGSGALDELGQTFGGMAHSP
jgi:hypothetical protein